MGTDHLKVVRFERRLRLRQRVEAAMRERGLGSLDRPIPLNTLIPLVETASSEQDDDLQDIWAKMLVNAGDVASPFEVRRAFVSMLSEMTAFDVRNLAAIHATDASTDAPTLIWTARLPDEALPTRPGGYEETKLRDDVEVSLGNLMRLGCIGFGGSFGGMPSPYFVRLTALGRAFILACTSG